MASGSAKGVAPTPTADPAAFAEQFDFAFAAPKQLPGGWTLAAGTPAGAGRVRLLYKRAAGELAVYLAKSGGPDTKFRDIQVGNRTVAAARRSGILVAFEGPPPEGVHWDDMARLFLAKGDEK